MNPNPLADTYLETLKRSLLNELYIENEARLVQAFASLLNNMPLTLGRLYAVDPGLLATLKTIKVEGLTARLNRNNPDGTVTPVPEMRNYTELAHTMIGAKRLDNIRECVETVLRDGIAGDLIETGIWRGGATIFMRAILLAHGVTDRRVWAADSFQGVPPPSRPEDAELDLSARHFPVLAVSRGDVEALFERYGLLDDQVRFLEGWFKDTLPDAAIERLAILRLDGDLYESTMDALVPLYDKVEPGGFVIVDDYCSCPPCSQAVDEFRTARGIAEPLVTIDQQSVFWRKARERTTV